MMYTVEGLENSRKSGFRPQKLLEILLKEYLNLNSNLKILDLGCGTGFFTRILKRSSNAKVIGMDINEELLNGARQIAQMENLDIDFYYGDITNIPYEDNTFDIVMCDIMLEIFEDKTIPLSEMKRVCKKGGLVVAIEPFYQSGFEYYPNVDKKLRDTLLKFSRAGRAYGVGPMLPELFHSINLDDIDLISWFWGRIGYRLLEIKTNEERIDDISNNVERIKKLLPTIKDFNDNEREEIVNLFEQRLMNYRKNPSLLKQDMSVTGLPVFIVKGTKTQ